MKCTSKTADFLLEKAGNLTIKDFAIYKAVRSEQVFGLSEDSTIVFGACLEPYLMTGHCVLAEILEGVGGCLVDCTITMPEGGLIVGRFYKAIAINISHDWESGVVDDYEVGFEEVKLTDDIWELNKEAETAIANEKIEALTNG